MRSERAKNIVIVLVILLLIVQVTKNSSSTSLGKPEQTVTVLHIQTERTGSCWFSTLEYSYQVPQCELLPVGFVGRVTGRVVMDSDSSSFSQKRLLFESIEQVVAQKNSVKYWGTTIVISLIQWRVQVLTTLEHYLEEPQAQIVSALLFGGSWRLDQTQQSLFKTIGIFHSVAASGFNLSFAISFVSGLERFLSRGQMVVLTLLVGACYLVLAEMSPSLVRAYAMLLVSLMARQIWRRPATSSRVFIVSTSLLVLLFPALSRLIGFQLSVGATAGIILFAAPLVRNSALIIPQTMRFNSQNMHDIASYIQKMKEYLWDTTLISVGAQLFVLPLLLYYFGSVSLFGIVATTMSAWLLPIIFVVGFATIAVLSVVPVLFAVVPLFLVLTVFITINQSGVNFAQYMTIQQSFSVFQLITSYALLAVVLFIQQYKLATNKYQSVSL